MAPAHTMRMVLCLVLLVFVASSTGRDEKRVALKAMTNKLQALHKSTKTLGHASGLRQYTDGDAQETAGIEVLGISFNSACMSQGCWEIDLKYNLVHKTLSVLYIPQTNGDDTLENGGGYSEAVSSTFEPKKFPCGVFGGGSTNACCIKDMLASYRTPSAFADYMTGTNMSTCPNKPLASSVIGEAVVHGFLEGKFSDMEYSEVVLTPDETSGEYHGVAKLRLDEKEVRTLAGKLEGHAAVEYTVNTFIGMVSFVSTRDENGDYANFMQVYHTQTPILLSKKNIADVVINGGFKQTFLNYVGTVLHNVAISEGAHADENAQFIQLSFTMPDIYTAAGDVIPFTSVRVGKAQDKDSIEEWYYPCGQSTSDASTIYGTAGIADLYETMAQKTCAPPADMCAQPLTLANGFVSYQFPLGLDFYTEADMTSKASIFLEFMVSVQDAENKLTGATALVQIPLEQAGHVTWCESEGASTDLLNVANIDIVIGTAETQGQLETQLTVLQNVMYSDASATTKAHSLQSGLISVVLKGSDSFFELPRAQNFYLELEDVVSLHFLETTNTKFDAVKALIDQGLAFETVVDAQGKANINPTIALLDLCPSDGSDMSCLSRRDVYKRASSFPSPVDTSSSQHGNTALEINPENTDNAKSFMATMLGTSSSWASGLGTAFSDILASKYDLNLRHKRAWWINPGSDWSKGTTPKFTLPSKMIVAMLVNLNEAGHVRRRTLVTSGSHSTTTTKTIPTPPRHVMQYTVERAGKVRLAPQMSPAKVSATSSELNFHVNPAEQIMTALGVDKSKSTTFQVEYVMPSDLLCMPEVEAKNKLGQTLLAGMKKAADVENVIVTSISVPAESKAECKRRFQRMSRTLKSAGAVAKIEILVVFSSAGHMVVNQAAFLASTPGMLALTPTDTSSAGKLSMDNSYVPPAAQLDKPVVAGTIAVPEVLSVSEGGGVPAMTVALGCTGAMALLATASALVMRRRAKLNTQRPTSSTLKVHSDDIESAPKTHCKPLVKEQDEVMCISGGISPVGPAPGARLRRSNSHEEMMLNQELGVKTLERTASGEAVLGIALHESIVSSSRTSTDRSFSRASSGCRPASAATSLFGSMATKPQNTAKTEKKFDFAERLAYITALVSGSSDQANEGPVTFGVAGPKGPAKNPASSIETAASGSPQKIKMKLDVVDWFGSRNSSVLSALSTDGASSPTRSIHSPDGSRSSSPLLKPWNRDRSRSPLRSDGTTSPTGSFKASKAYRGDLAAREMRQDRLHSAFDIPDEVSGNECSVKELKNTLRSLGVTETDILRCMEKSELQNLRITAETPKEIVPKVSGDDVESMLFRTQSGGEKTQLRFAQLLQLKPSTAL